MAPCFSDTQVVHPNALQNGSSPHPVEVLPSGGLTPGSSQLLRRKAYRFRYIRLVNSACYTFLANPKGEIPVGFSLLKASKVEY